METPIADHLKTHAAAIEGLRLAIGSSLPSYMDSLYLLRFCLSFPQEKERVEAVRKCIAWREANAGLLADAAAGRGAPSEAAIRAFQVAGFHGKTRRGDSLFVVRSGLCDPIGMMKAVSHEEFVAWLMYYREVGCLDCAAETARRGYLCKQVTLIDLKDSPITTFDTRYFKGLGEASNVSEYVYPQLLRRSVIFNPPSFFSTVFAFIRPFMSAKSLEKTTLCPGRTAARPSFSACPFASALFDGADLPTFLGGKCLCLAKGGCVSGRPNEQCRPGPAGGPREATIVVPARSVYDIHLAAAAPGHLLSYSFEVKDMGVTASAWLVAAEDGREVPLVAEAKHKAGGRVQGEVAVPAAGCVTLRFGNTHSLLTSKSVTVTACMKEGAAMAGGGGGAATVEGK